MEVSNLSNNFDTMSVGNLNKYNIAKDQTFMVYDFIHAKKKYCQVHILVPSMGRDKFDPKVIPGGKKLANIKTIRIVYFCNRDLIFILLPLFLRPSII